MLMMMLRTVTRGSDLSLLLVGDRQIGGRSAFRQPVVEPCQSGRDTWILVAQHVDELHGERIRDGPGRGVRQHFRGGLRRFAAHPEKSPGQRVRLQSCDLALFDPDGDATQVFNQDDAQGDRHRPKLADRERLDLLIGTDVAAQQLGVEATVGVGDIGPRHAEHARIAGEGT